MSATALVSSLRDLLGGEKVLSDFSALTAYSIDAGIYRIPPKAVVLVESEDDLARLLSFARERKVPLTARAGGTNLTGNAIGPGIIVDFSRMDRLLAVDGKAGWAEVQPGIVYAELNRILARHDLFFPPDPSSGEMCKIGGMLANNSAGPHSLKYGAVKENVLELDLLLADGRSLTARPYPVGSSELSRLLDEYAPARRLYQVVAENRDLILSRRKPVSKNSSGYNLFSIAEGLTHGVFDLAKIFIGSEGTLGLIASAKIRVLRRPRRTATALIYFNRLTDLADAVGRLSPLSPSALEMLDSNSMDLIGRVRFGIPESAAAMLLVEFDDEVEKRLAEAKAAVGTYRLAAPLAVATDPGRQEEFWQVRKAIYPTLYRYDPKKRPINFVDDVVVPVDRIPELIDSLDRIFADARIPVAIFGHIGDGNAHITPLLDANDRADFDRMVDLYHRIHRLVIEEFNGSLCGEHGDGRLRAEYLPRLYGPEIYRLFQEVKRAFDPEGLLNPGVKVLVAPAADEPAAIPPFTDRIDFERLSKSCVTCGKCNSVCPVYDVRRDESNAARGWFHILTSADYSYEKAGRVVEACLNCKSCRVVCPAGIDVSEEVLKRRAQRPNRLAGAIFALQERPGLFRAVIRSLATTQPLWDRRPVRLALEYLTLPLFRGIAPTARLPRDFLLPRLARRTLRERYPDLTGDGPGDSKAGIAYFHGCAANYFDDGVGEAVLSLLVKAGYRAELPPQRCSGTPIETYGHRERAIENARFNIAALAGYDRIVTSCASCTLMLKDYPKFFSGAEAEGAGRFARRVTDISELLESDQGRLRFRKVAEGTVTYHSSCHLRAAGITAAPRELLKKIPGLRFVEMEDADRCAGGAGTFCIKDPRLSRAIFERKRRAIEVSGAQIVATSCPACVIQLQNGLGGTAEVRHIAQILDRSVIRYY